MSGLSLEAWHLAIAETDLDITSFEWGGDPAPDLSGLTRIGRVSTFDIRIFPERIAWVYRGKVFHTELLGNGRTMVVREATMTWNLHHVGERDVRFAGEVMSKLKWATEWYFQQGFDKTP